MKTSTKIYLCAWTVAYFLYIGIIAWPSLHKQACNPNRIESLVDLRLPDILEVKSDDNLDRGASRFDHYVHDIKFVEDISEECIEEMERRCQMDSKHWSKNKALGYYFYVDSGGIDSLYEVSCVIYRDHAHIEYMISEDEGIFGIMALCVLYGILILWGVVLGIVAAVRKFRNRHI